MSPEDAAALADFGEDMFVGLVNLIGTCVMYGLYALSFFTALYMFCNKLVKGRQYKILLTLLVTSFFALTADLIDRSGSHLLSAFFALRYSSASDLSSDIVTAGNKDVPWEAIQYWGPTYTLCVGDSIVLWRAWVILDSGTMQRNRKRYLLWFVLILLGLGNIAVNIADAAFDDIGLNIQLSNGAITLDWVSLVVSLTVNAFATFLIGIKAWSLYRRSRDSILARNSQVKKVLLILIESGLGFCIIQLVYAVLNGVEMNNISEESASFITYAIVTAIANGCSALYPVAIIIIVHMEASPLTPSLSPAHSGPGYPYSFEMQDMTSDQTKSTLCTEVSGSKRPVLNIPLSV